MLLLIQACGGDDSGAAQVPPDSTAEAPNCEVTDGLRLEISTTIIENPCTYSGDDFVSVVGNQGYVSAYRTGCDDDGTGSRVDIYEYPSTELIYSEPQPDRVGPTFVPVVGTSSSIGSGVIAWQGFFRELPPIMWSMTFIDVLNQTHFASIIDEEHSYFVASLSDPYLVWTSEGQDGMGRMTVYDVSTLPELARPINAVAIHTGSPAATLSWTLPIPDTDGDGLDDVLLSGSVGMSYLTALLSHEDVLMDQGFVNATPITERPDIPTSAPDWDGDGLPDIALYNPYWIGAEIEIYNRRAEKIATFYREGLPENYPAEEPSFGRDLHTVTGILEEGEDALAFLDFTEEGSKVRILEPGSCGSESLAETAYFIPADEAIYYSAQFSGEVIAFPLRPESGPDGILLYHP